MATRSGRDPAGSGAEQKGRTPRLPDDARDFAESKGDTDLDLEAAREAERQAREAAGREGPAIGGQPHTGSREELTGDEDED